MRTIIAVFVMCFILSGCDKGQDTSGSMEKAPSQSSQKSMSSGSNMAIDHSADEKEFNLKRSLWGVEAMIEDYKANGYDTADLEKQKADLEKELKAMM